ncbi:MAG: FCD domain-containing protein [Isosphaeraceae bacterium]
MAYSILNLPARGRYCDSTTNFKAFDEFDVGLHRLIADRSDNPILAREIRTLQDMTMLIHDQLESFLIGGRRVDPAEQWDIRRNCWDEHNEIVAALKSAWFKNARFRVTLWISAQTLIGPA